jgi:LAO/AO transport system kinase
MAKGDKKKKSKKRPRSAMHVVRGVEGGHDGMAEDKPLKPQAGAGRAELSTDRYVAGVLEGDRSVLGRTITLIESNAPAHQDQAQEVLQGLMPHTGRSIRVGVTGVPGAGKSTLIDVLGCRLIDQGHQVAVMAVDPSSAVSRGSILGDKTRMEGLTKNTGAFIRPSPTGGTLGGVARKTRETMLLFEAAGYDVLLVETVGVGQSEITVRSMVDFFLLLLTPGGGDELQGIKRGVMELADAVVVNKADGGQEQAADRAREDYGRALHYLQPATEGWETRAFTASALNGQGIEEIWKVIETFKRLGLSSGALEKRRLEQARDWLHQMIEERLKDLFSQHPAVAAALPEMEKKVLKGDLPAVRAAWNLLETFEQANKKPGEEKRG